MKTIKGYIFLITWFFAFPFLLPAQQNYFSKVYYDPNATVQTYSCVRSLDNHYFIAGERAGNGLIIKADSAGDIIWSKTIGNDGKTHIRQVISTSDTCIMLVGRIINIIQSDSDLFYVKINMNGDTLWSGSIDFGDHEYATSVAETNDKGFIISGISSQIQAAPYSTILVCKLDSNGSVIWSKRIIGGNWDNHAYSIKQTTDSGYIVIGFVREHLLTGVVEAKTCLIKLFSNGNVAWAKTYEGPPLLSYKTGCDVIPLDNGFMLLIQSDNNWGMQICRADNTGNILWSRNYNVSNQSMQNYQYIRQRLHKTKDGGYIFATSGLSSGYPFVKTDSLGIPVWSKAIILATTDVLETPDNEIILVGNGSLYNCKDKYLNNDHIGIIKTGAGDSSNYNCNYDITITYDTILFTVGIQAFTSVLAGVVSPSHPEISNTPLISYNGCVDVYGSIEENKKENTLLVFPNPNKGKFQLRTPEVLYDASISMSDILGKCIYRQNLPEIKQIQLDISEQPDGLYYITITTKEAQYHTKLMLIK